MKAVHNELPFFVGGSLAFMYAVDRYNHRCKGIGCVVAALATIPDMPQAVECIVVLFNDEYTYTVMLALPPILIHNQYLLS
jgi:hypothetical protein